MAKGRKFTIINNQRCFLDEINGIAFTFEIYGKESKTFIPVYEIINSGHYYTLGDWELTTIGHKISPVKLPFNPTVNNNNNDDGHGGSEEK